MRTDLDAFAEAEIAVLENHGYLLADAAIQRHVRPLVDRLPEPVRLLERPATVPNPEWMAEARVRTALKESGTRRLFGRW